MVKKSVLLPRRFSGLPHDYQIRRKRSGWMVGKPEFILLADFRSKVTSVLPVIRE